MSASVADWLARLEQLHPAAIELGLQRIGQVWERLGQPRPAPIVITVAGTNGKGSTVAIMETILRRAGRRVGCYTSPHLQCYNERVRIDGQQVTDQQLIDSFERVDEARADLALTYFEFGTLAALLVLAQSGLDVALLEVGLGGRLDAVNVIDAEAAIVTSIGLDHTDWLGNDLEQIGREKAGVFRSRQIAVGSAPRLPASVAQIAAAVGAQYSQRDEHFSVGRNARDWSLQTRSVLLEQLLPPALPGPHQVDNAAGALVALAELNLLPGRRLINQALAAVRLAGRLQRVATDPLTVVDVAHNPAAAAEVGAALAPDRYHVVVGMLADKDAAGVAAALSAELEVVGWHLADLVEARGQTAQMLAERIATAAGAVPVACYDSVPEALQAARRAAGPDGRVLVLGSFVTAAAALAALASGKVPLI